MTCQTHLPVLGIIMPGFTSSPFPVDPLNVVLPFDSVVEHAALSGFYTGKVKDGVFVD